MPGDHPVGFDFARIPPGWVDSNMVQVGDNHRNNNVDEDWAVEEDHGVDDDDDYEAPVEDHRNESMPVYGSSSDRGVGVSNDVRYSTPTWFNAPSSGYNGQNYYSQPSLVPSVGMPAQPAYPFPPAAPSNMMVPNLGINPVNVQGGPVFPAISPPIPATSSMVEANVIRNFLRGLGVPENELVGDVSVLRALCRSRMGINPQVPDRR